MADDRFALVREAALRELLGDLDNALDILEDLDGLLELEDLDGIRYIDEVVRKAATFLDDLRFQRTTA